MNDTIAAIQGRIVRLTHDMEDAHAAQDWPKLQLLMAALDEQAALLEELTEPAWRQMQAQALSKCSTCGKTQVVRVDSAGNPYAEVAEECAGH